MLPFYQGGLDKIILQEIERPKCRAVNLIEPPKTRQLGYSGRSKAGSAVTTPAFLSQKPSTVRSKQTSIMSGEQIMDDRIS